MKEDYANMFVHGEFSLSFFGAFQSEDDYYGSDIIENLYKICLETDKLDYFDGLVKIKNSQ